MEYALPYIDSDTVNVYVYALPLWPLHKEGNNSFGVAVDDKVEVFENKFKEYSQSWNSQVLCNGVMKHFKLPINKDLIHHKLALICDDPGMMIQKGIVDWCGLNPSYIGPSLSANAVEKESSFKQTQKKLTEDDMSAYLLVYFKEHGHNVYFAVSEDGYTFTDVNNGEPIILGDTVAEQRGVRDPHIYRGPDNAFYMCMTDLHIYAREEGIRDTQWEREGYGWGNNRALVLMKSTDLINWKRTNIRLDKAFDGLEVLIVSYLHQQLQGRRILSCLFLYCLEWF